MLLNSSIFFFLGRIATGHSFICCFKMLVNKFWLEHFAWKSLARSQIQVNKLTIFRPLIMDESRKLFDVSNCLIRRIFTNHTESTITLFLLFIYSNQRMELRSTRLGILNGAYIAVIIWFLFIYFFHSKLIKWHSFNEWFCIVLNCIFKSPVYWMCHGTF